MSAPIATLVSAKDLCLQFGRQRVFNEATMAVHEGEKLGLVGRNGSGKSSLLKIVAGAEQPDTGLVARRSGLVTGYLAQEFVLDDEATVFENVRSGASELVEMIGRYERGEARGAEEAALLHDIQARDGWSLEARIATLTRELGLPAADRSVARLSGGEKRRVALARALAAQPDLLILDEPTNHLDAESILWLEEYLQSFPGAVLFVSHDRYFLDRIATRILEVDEGKLYSHPGNYTAYLESKAIRDAIDSNQERRRQAYLRHELEFVRAGVKAQRSKARTRLDTYDRIAAEEAPREELTMELVLPPPPPLANIVVEAKGMGARIGDRWLFDGLDLGFEAGTCTGIIGRNGLGKTTLLRLLMGEQEPSEGDVTIGKRTVFNYVDQQRLLLDQERSVMEEVADGSEFVTFGPEKLHVRTYLKRFLFTDERVTMRVRELSGGEQNRVLLAKILRRGGNFLILDEPTNDLDIPTMQVLEEAVLNFDGCVLVVSHDRWFLDRVCDRILAFEGGGQLHLCSGNYSYYLEKRGRQAAAAQAAFLPPSSAKTKTVPSPATVADPASQGPASKKLRKLSQKETRELESLEADIGTLESDIGALETELNDPAFYANPGNSAEAHTARIDELKATLESRLERWSVLEDVRASWEAHESAG